MLTKPDLFIFPLGNNIVALALWRTIQQSTGNSCKCKRGPNIFLECMYDIQIRPLRYFYLKCVTEYILKFLRKISCLPKMSNSQFQLRFWVQEKMHKKHIRMSSFSYIERNCAIYWEACFLSEQLNHENILVGCVNLVFTSNLVRHYIQKSEAGKLYNSGLNAQSENITSLLLLVLYKQVL